jgi:pyridoxine 5-phosphate synthase
VTPQRHARCTLWAKDLDMASLCVNIDHVATVRQARRTWEPDPVWAAVEAQLGGAAGITVHLREDRRHVQDGDLARLKGAVHVRLNLEMAATAEMVRIARALRPHMAMLVPEGRREITTEGGLDVAGQRRRVKGVVARLKDAGIGVSIFIDAMPRQVEAAAQCAADVCEVHTGPYAHAFHDFGRDGRDHRVVREVDRIRAAGALIQEAGMQFNAGHALNYLNVGAIAMLPGIAELHIGHSIVSRAIFVGLRRAVEEMRSAMQGR